jgi:hypothetical protein
MALWCAVWDCRWEQEVVVLERCVLAQQASTYELSGEYVLPPGIALPSTLLPEPGVGGTTEPAPQEDDIEGRWRLQVIMAAAQRLSALSLASRSQYQYLL